MFHIEDVLQVKDGEDIKGLVRRHPVTLVASLFLALICVVVPFFYLFQLFRWGTPGIVAFFVLVATGIVFAIRTVLVWDADVLIITTFRLVEVDQRGLFSRFVTDAALGSIREVTWRRHGFIETLFRTGTLEVQTDTSTTAMVITHVSRPDELRELVNDLRHATSPKKQGVSLERQERLRKISGVLENLSDEALYRVEESLQREVRSQAMGEFLKPSETEGRSPSGFKNIKVA